MLTLSVISPAYNEEDYVIPFLESVAAQTWPDFEFIIVDDASTDRTAELIAAYLPRIGRPAQFIRHERNMGEGKTLAEAFARATGDICLKVDADSLLEPEALARVMASFSADKQAGMVATLILAMERTNWVLRGTEVLCAAKQRYDRMRGGYTTTAYGTCLAFRRDLFSAEEISTRTDDDLSQLARKRGWRIVLRNDVAVRTRFPATLPETFARGRQMAWQELPTYWHHKELFWTRWSLCLKAAPLGVALTALFKPRWALAGLLGWLSVTEVFLARQVPDYPFLDRLAAWGVTVVRWSGYDLEVPRIAARALANWLGPGVRLRRRKR